MGKSVSRTADASLSTGDAMVASATTVDDVPMASVGGDVEVEEKTGQSSSNSPAAQNVSPSESPSPDRKRRKTNSPFAAAGGGGRVSRSPFDRRSCAANAEANDKGSGGVSSKKKSASSKQQDKEDMAWICAECKEADCGLVSKQQATGDGSSDPKEESSAPGDSFLICDGSCRRIFHVPCAGLAHVPDSDDDWLCKDCSRKEHACGFCGQYGKDNEDVFPCQDEVCGLFFHESCLQTHHVEYEYSKRDDDKRSVDLLSGSPVEDDLEEEQDAEIPVFTCPAHDCWTCTQRDMVRLEKEEGEEAKRRQNGNKKNKRKKRNQSIFQSKPGRLFQCLYCPKAYHVTCLPPTARFHELAILCHEHAISHRLPKLDMNVSIQSKLETKVNQTYMRLHGQRAGSSKRKKGISFGRGPSANPFFHGLRGDRFDAKEAQVLRSIKKTASSAEYESTDAPEPVFVQTASAESMALDGDLPFCLPVDMMDEVYSKPPPYMHVQSLKYDSDKSNRPKKITSTGTEEKEKCSCTKTCGFDCFNRVTMSECVGPANCKLGGKDCGNRSLGKKQFVKCQPKRERGKGWGLVTLEFIPKGTLVQEYMGEVINEKEKERRLITWNEEHPNDPNFYVMALSTGYYVDAREYANLARFINHSCDPNCKVSGINVKGYIRNGIYSLRDIHPGEFLSYDYHFDTKQGDRFVCRCGAMNCRGTMKGQGKDALSKLPANWKEAKARYEADKKFLEDAEKTKVVSLVGSLLPCAEHPNETVANGPLLKHRDEAIRSRIFLWRNLRLGTDFVSRNARLEKAAVTREHHK